VDRYRAIRKANLEALLAVSIIGPIGLPWGEAVFPPIATGNRSPMNAMHDYVVRMSPNELPPAKAEKFGSG